jgi:hypothetical protein
MPTKVDLQSICKRKGIKGYSKLNKKQLEKLVKKALKKKAPKKKAPKKKVTKGGATNFEIYAWNMKFPEPAYNQSFSQNIRKQRDYEQKKAIDLNIYLKLDRVIVQKIIVNTFALSKNQNINNIGWDFDIGIEILPNLNNLGVSTEKWEGIAQLTQFPFRKEYVKNMNSYLKSKLSPMDCFINACQLIGVLDTLNANILRISCIGRQGINIGDIEKIFTIKSASLETPSGILKNLQRYYKFTSLNNLGDNQIEIFFNILKNNLKKGFAAFCGWQESGGAHVFIIAKLYNKEDLWYLDPQKVGSPCKINNNIDCQNLLHKGQVRKYFILYNTSINDPIPNNIIKDMGFDLSSGRSVNTQETVFNNN